LKLETQPVFKLIYPLSEKKHEALQKYINKNLKKEYIRLLTLPAEYSILFIFKKNKKL